MGFYEGMMPKEQKQGYRGFYPVTSAEEWDELPVVYKVMEWMPVEVYNRGLNKTEQTVAEYIEFDVWYMEPYKIRATVRVHRENFQKIMFCSYDHAQCHLYTVSGVVFENGERWRAEWRQDSTTGAFAIYAGGKQIGMQGGYMGFIPSQVERTEDGFRWKGFTDTVCHYQMTNPFK